MVTLLVPLGLLTTIDRSALAAYCQTYSRWCEAEERVRDLGIIIESPNGFPIQNPYLSVANSAIKTMKGFLTEFGLTPSSRSRISIKPNESKEDSEEDRFF